MAKQVAAAWWEAPLRFGVRKLLHFTTHIYFSSIEVRGLRNVQRLAGLSTTTSPPTAAGATTTGNTNTTTGNTTATTTAGATQILPMVYRVISSIFFCRVQYVKFVKISKILTSA